jgi:hypothetical protein
MSQNYDIPNKTSFLDIVDFGLNLFENKINMMNSDIGR